MQTLNFGDWLANEMALRKMELVPPHNPENPKSAWAPNAKKRGWDDASAKLVTSPAGVQKFTRLWANTEHVFEFYLMRAKNAHKHVEVGEVDMAWIKNNLPELANIEPQEDAITVVFTNNKGAEGVPFTGWTAAHRFGHAMDRRKGGSMGVHSWYYFSDSLQKKMEQILQKYYGHQPQRAYYSSSIPDDKTSKLLGRLGQGMGTFRSARQDNIRNFNEFHLEVLAQYLVTKNKVQFEGKLGRMLVTKYAWGRPSSGAYMRHDANKEELEESIHDMAEWCNDMLNEVMLEATGRIFVM